MWGDLTLRLVLLIGIITVQRTHGLRGVMHVQGAPGYYHLFRNMRTRARAEGAQFYVFEVVAKFCLTVFLHMSLIIVFVGLQSVSL
jgi:hypothetical protein